ncbi:MAG: hypothetical protein FWD61_01025 [Phycisphaerales bacterium]|nr:hypothetical protein [Phycisphaerales bacterium]
MKLERNIKVFMIAMICVLGIFNIAIADNPPAKPKPKTTKGEVVRMLHERGRVNILLTEAIKEEDIKKMIKAGINANLALTAEKDLVQFVTSQVDAYLTSLKDKDIASYNLISKYKNELIDALIKKTQDLIKKGDEVVTAGVDKAVAETASTIKAAIDLSAAMNGLSFDVISAYRYKEKERNPGSPGWDKPTVSNGSFVNASGSFKIGFQVSAGVSAIGEATVPIQIEIKVDAKAVLKSKYVEIGTMNIPETTATVIPAVDVSVGLSVEVKAGVTAGGSREKTETFELPEIKKDFKADGNPQKD